MKVIGIDVGTTGTKAAVLDGNGRVLSSGYREYPTRTAAGGISEQDARDWWLSAVAAVRQALASVDPASVRAISVSAQGASGFCADEHAEPLAPAVTWLDARSIPECEELTDFSETVYRKCGWALGPMGDIAKFRHLKRHDPGLFSRTKMFLSTLEYLNAKLTGTPAIDETTAAMRQLLDVTTGAWDAELLSFAGIGEDRLPPVVRTGTFLGNLLPEAAAQLGLSREVRVYQGAHDQYCASLGSGTTEVGQLLLATGTAWVLLGVSEKPLFCASHLSPCRHPAGGRFGNIGSLYGAGSGLKWLKNLLKTDYAAIDSEAETRRESAKDLLFYPYFMGAGFPHNDRSECARVLGMRLENDGFDLARALMEGAAFETMTAISAFVTLGLGVGSVRMTGGASGSKLWRGIVADVTGLTLSVPKNGETCCAGAAMIALVGEGVFSDYGEAAAGTVRFETVRPDPEGVSFYREKYARYFGERHEKHSI